MPKARDVKLIYPASVKPHSADLAKRCRMKKGSSPRSAKEVNKNAKDKNNKSISELLGASWSQQPKATLCENPLPTNIIETEAQGLEQVAKRIRIQNLELSSPSVRIGAADEYVAHVKQRCLRGSLVKGQPWIKQECPIHAADQINEKRYEAQEEPIDAAEALNLVLRPSIFVWAPDQIFPGVTIRCPTCASICSFRGWGKTRVLHHLSSQSLYIATQHACDECAANARENRRRAEKKRFLSDSPLVVASLPLYVQAVWDFVNTGNTLCDASVLDFVRSLALQTSWAGIANSFQEMKSTSWVKNTVLQYFHLCEKLGLQPERVSSHLPRNYILSEKWVRKVYIRDAARRKQHMERTTALEKGDDFLKVDWTKAAASRCNCNFLFNAMDAAGHILATVPTRTCKPFEVQALISSLASRGVCPKVVYVDDECCGAWKVMLKRLWPDIAIRLDAMHAIMRLTQTTPSTQHPWHDRFCATVSKAFWTFEPEIADRFQKAWRRAGHGCTVPTKIWKKFVPRRIAAPANIVIEIEAALGYFQANAPDNGSYVVTQMTMDAWKNLKKHVVEGCLSDPVGMVLHGIGDPISIAGEDFHPVRSKRGVSSLEGFHTHYRKLPQSRWCLQEEF